MKKIILVFDCIRDPRDLANMIHLAIATNTKIVLTGNSLSPTHYKVINILKSWIKEINEKEIMKIVKIEQDYFKFIKKIKKEKYKTYGTSPNIGQNLFEKDLSKKNHAIIFGTESSGLTKEKMNSLDGILKIPMKNNTKFFTLTAIAPTITYEILRQKKLI